MKIISFFLKSSLAGFAISIGAVLYILCSSYIPNGNYLGSILFSVGLISICFGGFHLYTGKIGFFFSNKNKKDFSSKLIGILITNICSCFLFGFIFSLITRNNSVITSFLNSLYEKKSSNNLIIYFVNSSLCGVFVYSGVHFFKLFKKNIFKVLGIVLSISLFVLFSFDHCIANSFYFSAANKLNDPYSYLLLFVAIIGNSFGSICFNSLISKD